MNTQPPKFPVVLETQRTEGGPFHKHASGVYYQGHYFAAREARRLFERGEITAARTVNYDRHDDAPQPVTMNPDIFNPTRHQ